MESYAINIEICGISTSNTEKRKKNWLLMSHLLLMDHLHFNFPKLSTAPQQSYYDDCANYKQFFWELHVVDLVYTRILYTW